MKNNNTFVIFISVIAWLLLACGIVCVIVGYSKMNDYNPVSIPLFYIAGSAMFMSLVTFIISAVLNRLSPIADNSAKIIDLLENDKRLKGNLDVNEDYAKWQKENPGKTINDYYSRK